MNCWTVKLFEWPDYRRNRYSCTRIRSGGGICRRVKHSKFKRLAVFAVLVCSVGVRAEDSAVGHLTFNKDVAPIIFEHCSICHRAGQAAPFKLLTYQEVKQRAKQIVEVVDRRYMPPWLPEAGHEEFVGDRSLSKNQIETIRQWVAEGAREGKAADLPPTPQWPDGWRLGKPDLVVRMPAAYKLASEGKDVYRNLVVPIPVPEQKFVKGVEFLPGNWRVVHHAFINIDTTRFSRNLADKESPAGFDGMVLPETARMPGGHLLGWQPGKMPMTSPDGLAWVLPTNTDLVLQLHLHPTGKSEVVQPSVAFYFTDQAPTNMAFRINLNPLIIDIPAGATNYTIEDSYVLPLDVEVLGICPHAHYLGKRLEGSAILPDGTRKDLIVIPDWDFNWQGEYRYAKPIFLPKGTKVTMRFSYDNSVENVRNPNHPPKRVKYGLQTTDEMGELWLQVLPMDPAERQLLAGDFYGHLASQVIRYNEHVLTEDPTNAEAHTLVGRSQLYLRQVTEAMAHFQAAVKANPNYDPAWYELGFVALRTGDWEGARQAFENVVRLNPQDYQAHGSLGALFLQRGDLVAAETQFRTALRINPQDDVSRANLDRVLQARSKTLSPGQQ